MDGSFFQFPFFLFLFYVFCAEGRFFFDDISTRLASIGGRGLASLVTSEIHSLFNII